MVEPEQDQIELDQHTCFVGLQLASHFTTAATSGHVTPGELGTLIDLAVVAAHQLRGHRDRVHTAKPKP